MPDEPTIRLLTSLRRYFTDQQANDGDNAEYYLGAAVALETALKLLAGPMVPRVASTATRRTNGVSAAEAAPTKSAPLRRAGGRSGRRAATVYQCACGKAYTVGQSLTSHLKRNTGKEHHRVK